MFFFLTVFCQLVPVPDQILVIPLSAHLMLNQVHSHEGLMSLIHQVKRITLPPVAGLAQEVPIKARYLSGLKEQVSDKESL